MANVYVWGDLYECDGDEHPTRNPNDSVFTECVRREDYDALLARLAEREAEIAKNGRHAMRVTIAQLEARLAAADVLIGKITPRSTVHYQCDDSWYSCPKSEEGCSDETQGEDCNCGADAIKALIDAYVIRQGNESAARSTPGTPDRS